MIISKSLNHVSGTDNLNLLFIFSIIFVSSLVIADQKVPLDLNLRFDHNNVQDILDRQDWREATEEENNWRESKPKSSSTYTWGAISIYEDNHQLEPIIPSDNETSSVVDERKAAPKLQLRF